MFTIAQIESAHYKVKSGADFPAYIREIKNLGVRAFETFACDSHTNYFGKNDFKTTSEPKFPKLQIAKELDSNQFRLDLKSHQNAKTDYMTFCVNCAKSGIAKWVCDLEEMTCTYFDFAGNKVLTEKIAE
ncbi:DUF1398 family protein [Flavobacterium sp.]|uniref:DUF1398 domain-containing protein n=1 Tax=Flavobacterium sp. TaxID=239 RepID=UPI00122AD988|nr:DUF1398 family protein [Flavobacterium sp.]RZJ71585.1 MAG: DUF1398 domain-containing protein [Flavobacterium sp.]